MSAEVRSIDHEDLELIHGAPAYLGRLRRAGDRLEAAGYAGAEATVADFLQDNGAMDDPATSMVRDLELFRAVGGHPGADAWLRGTEAEHAAAAFKRELERRHPEVMARLLESEEHEYDLTLTDDDALRRSVLTAVADITGGEAPG